MYLNRHSHKYEHELVRTRTPTKTRTRTQTRTGTGANSNSNSNSNSNTNSNSNGNGSMSEEDKQPERWGRKGERVLVTDRVRGKWIFGVVATYPSVGGRRGAHGCVFHGRKMHGVATNVYSRKTSEKLERCGLWTLSVKGLGVVFTHGEGISTPRIRHKGRQPSIKCANMTSKLCIFLFLCFYVFLCRFVFFYLFVVDKGVSLAPTYPQLRWGNRTYVVLSELNVG